MWPKLLDMSKDECKRLLRRIELEAYAGIISAFRAQGDLTKDKKQILDELATTLSISTERHRAEVRRAVNDEKLSTVAERLSGPNNSSEWAIEGRRLIPLMPRLVPQTVFSLTANQAANAAFSHNLTLPLPSQTAKKEASSENSVKLPSPSSNVVVLPSGLSIPIKGGPDVDVESIPAKKSRRDSSHLQSKEPISSSVAPVLQTSLSPSLSVPSMSFTKSTTGNTITSNRSSSLSSSKHQVILVSSSSTSYTPSILQRSQSVPSAKPSFTKAGTKQSVILTSVSGQSFRQSESVSVGKHPGIAAGARQHTGISNTPLINRQKIAVSGRQGEASGSRISTSDMMPGTTAGGAGARKQSGNVGSVSAVNSSIITARTTASVISSQMTYVAPSMAGKPRGRAVSKQKLQKQVNMTPTCGITTPTEEVTSSKKQPGKSDIGMKILTQSVTAGTKLPRSSNQSSPLVEMSHKVSLATGTISTGKPVTSVAGHKVIISSTSAGVVPHHVAVTTPLIRTKPSTVSSMSSVNAKVVQGGTVNIGSGSKVVVTSAVVNQKVIQTIKATTTANVSQTVTSIVGSKSSMLLHKSYTQGSQVVISDPSKSPQAHVTSSLLQRPKISMVSAAPTSTTAPSFLSAGICFPSPQNTSSIAMTSVKSSGSRGMRSPITMVTPGSLLSQKRSVGSVSPNTLQSSGNTRVVEDVQSGRQGRDYSGSFTRGLLGSYPHPNNEWIDYDGSPPDSSASSAIKALLEFRSHPDAQKHSQTIDLSHIGSKSASKTTSLLTMPSTQLTTAPSRLTHRALLTTRVPQPATDMPTLGSPAGDVSQSSPTLLTNIQSRLKKALMSDRPEKPASAASFLQSATAEVEKAFQEQSKIHPAKQDVSLKETVLSCSQDERASSPSRQSNSHIHMKGQSQKGKKESQEVTIEDQGVVTDRVNVSSEEVSSFVDQFEQFLESEGIEEVSEIQEKSQSDHVAMQKSSVSKKTGQSTDSFKSLSEVLSSTPAGLSDCVSSGSVATDFALPSWRKKTDFETLTCGQKGAASVVMESTSVDISQMKLEDFTSQRLQDSEDVDDEKQSNTSLESSPVKITGSCVNVCVSAGTGLGSEETQGVRISNRKRKAPAPIDEEPGPTSMSSWARAAFNLLQRVMRFRGANRSKGDLNAASWFTRPVAASEAPGYNRVIKYPMDFGTVKRKLENGRYDNFADFHNDMMLVHNNCVQYNPPGHEIRRDCEEVFQFYTAEYKKLIERWEKLSPKKPKVEDQRSDKGKSIASRSIIL
ncbi:BRCA2-interacting transcriptional repressor EMSY-like isoform X2 [Acanthaster planci]|uniref:BRCA2-interacting transcriptional repressor EMSY-like isoform X2 n=1 Tax=Acanthaster planci TaxID=133434 RepID=A0A8B7YZ84_ACAPL|nr:BRCA2-interacting transcriptional repressor EMSY-like isoform X2 [Acanthaster planci]